jgi:predicted secreted hydrolase
MRYVHNWRRITALGVAAVLALVPVRGAAAADSTADHLDQLACAAGSAPTSVPADPAFPTFPHLPGDLAAHPGIGWEAWYFVGHLCAGPHRFAYQIALTVGATGAETNIAVTDLSTGAFHQKWTAFPLDQVSASASQIDVRMPTGSVAGTLSALSLHGILPDGDISLGVRATGPALYFGGTGFIPLWGTTTYNVELPYLAATGSVTLDGTKYPVTGTAWLDHQYFGGDFSKFKKWTWMGLTMDNGDRIALLDNYSTVDEDHAATVLHPDGSMEVAALVPLAEDAGDFWTSPATGKRFPTHWVVRIPSNGTRLVVDARPRAQEIVRTSAASGVYEGAATATGTYRGRPAHALAHVEMLGGWS